MNSAHDAPPTASHHTAAFDELEAARCAAMIAGDGTALRKLLAADFAWIHSSGQVNSRDDFIAKIEDGTVRYLAIERSEAGVRLYGPAAVATGVATMTALADGERRSLRNRYVNVWVMQDGRAVLVSAQSTKLA